MWELPGGLVAVPRRLIWDNESGIGRRNRYAAGMAAFSGVLGTRIVQVKPYGLETKGIVERAKGYLESFLFPGRTFSSPTDFNDQLAVWLSEANTPLVRSTGFHARVCLPRDYYVRVSSIDYSVDPQAIGRFVDVSADLETVRISIGDRTLGTHPRSCGEDTKGSMPKSWSG